MTASRRAASGRPPPATSARGRTIRGRKTPRVNGVSPASDSLSSTRRRTRSRRAPGFGDVDQPRVGRRTGKGGGSPVAAEPGEEEDGEDRGAGQPGGGEGDRPGCRRRRRRAEERTGEEPCSTMSRHGPSRGRQGPGAGGERAQPAGDQRPGAPRRRQPWRQHQAQEHQAPQREVEAGRGVPQDAGQRPDDAEDHRGENGFAGGEAEEGRTLRCQRLEQRAAVGHQTVDGGGASAGQPHHGDAHLRLPSESTSARSSRRDSSSTSSGVSAALRAKSGTTDSWSSSSTRSAKSRTRRANPCGRLIFAE